MVTPGSLPHPTPLVFRALQLHQSGKSEDALSLLKKAVEIKPGLVDAWCNQGNVQPDLGHNEPARKSYDRVLSLEPEHPAPSQLLAIHRRDHVELLPESQQHTISS